MIIIENLNQNIIVVYIYYILTSHADTETNPTRILTMIYDFRKMTEKDMFEAKLKHATIDFGFIPIWRFGRFVKFCKKHGLLYHPPTYFDCAYLVKHNFRYTRTFSRINHLPMGWLAAWIADIFYADTLFYKHSFKYVYREPCFVKPRGTKPGFTYVTATSQGISL